MCTLFLFCYSCPVCYSLNLNYIPLVSGICLVLSENTSFLCTCYSLSLCLSCIIQLFFKITFFFLLINFPFFQPVILWLVTVPLHSFTVTFFFLSLVLFHLPFSIFTSYSSYLPITLTCFSSTSVFLCFSFYRIPFPLVVHSSTTDQSYFYFYSVSLPKLLFHLLFTTLPFLPFSFLLFYTVIATVWNNPVIWL